ncbi:hypothetical protein INS49_003305 [Diaporthe citri]|uniref:uncharacterized protein n=1 Tax=Diaporthe citri TaxID=83186 RepID=UPI001C8253D3|nr:uncharacterized protein INS49_003305 [Diaporthe citri]KAG6355344.1 hypothetical protein INS49_003305 [Diaporthe citri]
MMNFSAFAPLSFLLGQFSAVTPAGQMPILNTDGFSSWIIGNSTGGDSTCVSGNILVPINATGTNILYTAPQNQARVTESFVELNQVDSTFAMDAVSGGPSVISGSYSIFCKLCLPSDPAKAGRVKTVQLLTHGATLDHTYWDIAPGYSYVDVAAAAGYATLSYDQLGVGNSDHPDPIQVVQAASQVAVTHRLVELLRGAKLGGFDFDRVVGVGHSAGSTLTQAITTRYPQDFDAVILSGTSTSAASVALSMAAFNFINANTDPSPKLRNLPAGYLTQQSAVGIQFAFYRYPNFDQNAFERQVADKQTNTLGILLTLGGTIAPSAQFAGPVDVVNGENDLVFCGGNCLYPTDQNAAVLAVFYPAASSGCRTYIAAGAGHSIAAHKSGPDSFAHMVGFLQANGL